MNSISAQSFNVIGHCYLFSIIDSPAWAHTCNGLPYNILKGLNLSLLLGATDQEHDKVVHSHHYYST